MGCKGEASESDNKGKAWINSYIVGCKEIMMGSVLSMSLTN